MEACNYFHRIPPLLFVNRFQHRGYFKIMNSNLSTGQRHCNNCKSLCLFTFSQIFKHREAMTKQILLRVRKKIMSHFICGCGLSLSTSRKVFFLYICYRFIESHWMEQVVVWKKNFFQYNVNCVEHILREYWQLFEILIELSNIFPFKIFWLFYSLDFILISI